MKFTGSRVLVLALTWSVALGGCTTAYQRIPVSSVPAGARILIDHQDTGKTTPAEVNLPTEVKQYTLTLEKSGYNPITRELRLGTDVEVIDADEFFFTVLCSPCCLFLPLIGMLDDLVTVDTHFVPSRISAVLELAGQGVKLDLLPPEAEVYIDDALVHPVEGSTYVMSPGRHQLEVRAEGYRPYRTELQVEPLHYQAVTVHLKLEGQGLLLRATPVGARTYLNGQFVGAAGPDVRRIPTAPGPHSLRVEFEGYRSWEDVVVVKENEYAEIDLPLILADQGVIVRRPPGLRRTAGLKIFIDGSLQGTEFDTPLRLDPGSHAVEIQIEGRPSWRVSAFVTENEFLDVTPDIGGRR